MEKRIYLRDERFYRHMWKMREADWEKISLMTLERATASCRGLCSSRKIPHRAKLPAWMDRRKKSSFFSLNFKIQIEGLADGSAACSPLLQDLDLVLNTSIGKLTIISLQFEEFRSSLLASRTVHVHTGGAQTCTRTLTHNIFKRSNNNCWLF